jgi:hypothetical protein
MNYRDMSENEFDMVIEYLKENQIDLEKYMVDAYKELLFLGNSITTLKDDSLDASMFCLKLCMRYYMITEDYLKLKKLSSIYNEVAEPKKRIVEESVIKSIVIHEN